MPFTNQQIADAAKSGLDFYMKNPPTDIIAIKRPLFDRLQETKKDFPGAKQYVIEQLRLRYQGNLQWYRGSGTVTYTDRQTLEQSQFPWRSAHDGLSIDEDRLAQNGIATTETKMSTVDRAELIQLTNLLEEQNETLKLGFQEKFSLACHLDGSQSADVIAGLDFLVTVQAVPTAAAQQVVGGLDRFNFPVWQNQVATGITIATMLATLETQFRKASANGGPPDFFPCGGVFIDSFRSAATAAGVITRYTTAAPKGGTALDPSITDLHFHGVPLTWCPEWDDNFGGAVNPSPSWANRGYMLNTKKSLRLRPLSNQDMVSRKPPRPSNAYVAYMALTWKGAMTLSNSRNNVAMACTGS